MVTVGLNDFSWACHDKYESEILIVRDIVFKRKSVKIE